MQQGMDKSVLCLLVSLSCVKATFPPPCDSEIYCSGDILQQVQMAKLFDDDKYFVDMKLKAAPDFVLSAFQNLSNEWPNTTLPTAELQEFLAAYFEEPGSEFEPWSPPDWHDKPQFLLKIADPELRSWAGKLHQLWKSLGRKIRADVKDHPELYSQIYTPHPVIVPGGRFRELYYWDSYWIINGLLLSEMTDTARGMILNFLYLVDRYGFIPNGGRIYYERRSQPPFLTLMLDSYYQATKEESFLSAALPALEQEYHFWMQNRSVTVEVNGTEHRLNRYNVEVGSPRPESYTDDVELAEGLTNDAQEQLWADLKAGAESGWDFSSRWFVDAQGENGGTLGDTRTSHILPVDLNALLCRNERLLASFHRILEEGTAPYCEPDPNVHFKEPFKRPDSFTNVPSLALTYDDNLASSICFYYIGFPCLGMISGNPGVSGEGDGEGAERYERAAARRLEAMEAVLWDAERGAWFDYSLVTHSKHLAFYPSNLAPIWAECYSQPAMAERAVLYLKDSGALVFPNGVPTSLTESSQQWDLPNAWPPLQQMLIQGLFKLPSDETKQMALDLAQKWIRTNWRAFVKYEAMFEKYDVNGDGKPGGGGEYEVQLGFGWTNGVALQILEQFGSDLTAGSGKVSPGGLLLLLPLVASSLIIIIIMLQ